MLDYGIPVGERERERGYSNPTLNINIYRYNKSVMRYRKKIQGLSSVKYTRRIVSKLKFYSSRDLRIRNHSLKNDFLMKQ